MDKNKPKFVEQMEVAGEDLVTRVRELFADTNAKRVVLRDSEGRELISIPLAVGVAGGALAVFLAPALAAVAAVGGAVAKVRIDVERDTPAEPDPTEDVPPDPSANI